MKSLALIFNVLMCLSNFNQIRGAEMIDVTYDELVELNATCFPYDTCSRSHEPLYYESLIDNKCNCDAFCSRYGTCCVDSGYKHMPAPKTKPTCRPVNGLNVGYLMIDQCPQSGDSQSMYEELCKDEWNGENDIMRLVPVTSLFTHITYKNYFCFKCHETNDDSVFWNVRTEYKGQSPIEENSHVQLEFDRTRNSWVAPLGQRGAFIPVPFPKFDVHFSIFNVPRICRLDVISKCSEYWEDDTIRAKCGAYMAITTVNREGMSLEYRNPHCAICNFEDLNDLSCRPRASSGEAAGGGSGGSGVLFSFTLLLDINRSDGDKVGKIQKCDSSDVWDPFFKKCRSVKCVLPGYVVKDGQCIVL